MQVTASVSFPHFKTFDNLFVVAPGFFMNAQGEMAVPLCMTTWWNKPFNIFQKKISTDLFSEKYVNYIISTYHVKVPKAYANE